MEVNPPYLTKKLCNLIRIAFFTVQKGVAKSKFMVDLNLMMTKRGKIIKKAMNDLMLEHQTSLMSCRSDHMDMSFVSPMSCRSHDVRMSFISPHEYEFSCSSNTSSYKPYRRFHSNKRRSTRHYQRNHRTNYHPTAATCIWEDEAATEESGGFGWSPAIVRQVRITDSPFTVREDGDGVDGMKVDMEAEKFIERFYRELRLQKWMAAHETEDNHGWRA